MYVNMKKGVIFDFFGVISSEVAPIWYPSNIADPRKAEDVRKEYSRLVDSGAIDRATLADRLSAYVKKDRVQIDKEWRDLVHIDRDILFFVEELRKAGNIVALLTNVGNEFFEEVEAMYGIRSCFDVVIISSLVRLVKPQPKIYRLALQRMGCTAETTVMIDDSSVNIRGAEVVGMRGIVYRDLASTKKELEKMGVTV
jgi:HAD superfamily hydrolase (TIGR01509 family)